MILLAMLPLYALIAYGLYKMWTVGGDGGKVVVGAIVFVFLLMVLVNH
jgi:hypothetical protein